MLQELRSLHSQGKIATAETAFRRMLDQVPNHFFALMGLGACARLQGDDTTALEYFSLAHSSHPSEPQAAFDYGIALRDSGNVEMALKVFANQPDHLGCCLELGNTARRAKQAAMALTAHQAALQISPDNPDILLELARDYQMQGATGEANAVVALLQNSDPDHPGALLLAAEWRVMEGALDEALALRQKCHSLYPGNRPAALALADLLADVGRMDEALNMLSQLEIKDGPQSDLVILRAQWLRQRGFPREALALTQSVRSIWPHDFRLWSQALAAALLIAPDGEVASLLSNAPARTAAQRSQVKKGNAQFAERQGKLEEAFDLAVAANALQPAAAPARPDAMRLAMLILDLPAARQIFEAHVEYQAETCHFRGIPIEAASQFFSALLAHFERDSEISEVLRNLRLLSPSDRVRPLLNLAQKRPEALAPSLSLMVALRRISALSGFGEGGDGGIPKKIGQYWDVDPPEELMRVHNDWRKINSDYTVNLFDDEMARTFLHSYFPSEISFAYDHASAPAQKADIFRLAYLWHEGGVWADMDDQPTNPLDDIIPIKAEAVFYQEYWGTLGNNFIAARPRMAVIEWALQNAVRAISEDKTESIWFSTGPALLTRAFTYQLTQSDDPDKFLDRYRVVTRAELFQCVSGHIVTTYKRSRKHWTDAAFLKKNGALS